MAALASTELDNRGSRDSTIDDVLEPRIPTPSAETLYMEHLELGSNYRQRFNELELLALAKSIREEGLMKPVIVNRTYDPEGNPTDTLVAGQRRYMAHVLNSAGTIECMVYQDLTFQQVLQIQLAENLQEKIAIEERAESYWQMYLGALSIKTDVPYETLVRHNDYWKLPQDLRSRYPMTEFCRDVGKAHGRMIDMFRWQRMHKRLKKYVEEGKMHYTAAAELARIPNKNDQVKFVQPGGVIVGTGKSIRKIVDDYFRDQQMFQEGLFALEARSAKMQTSSVAGNATSALLRFADFLRAYRELCAQLPELRGAMDCSSRGSDLKRYVASASAMRPDVDGSISESVHYAPAVKAEKKRSLREIIMDDDCLKARARSGCNTSLLDGRRMEFDYIPTGSLDPDLGQPRRKFQAVQTLAESVRVLGVLQPIMVMPTDDGRYRIITGHRRTRAALKVGLRTIPAKVVYGLSEAEIRLLQHKEDTFASVSLGDRAEAIFLNKRLLEQRHLEETGEEIRLSPRKLSQMMPGFGESEIESALKFHELPERIKVLEERGLLKYSVAVQMGGFDDSREAYLWAVRAALGGWTVADTENALRQDRRDRAAYATDLFGTTEEQATLERIEGLRHMLTTDIVAQFGCYVSALRNISRAFEQPNGVSGSILRNRRLVEAYVDSGRVLKEVSELLPDLQESA